MKKIFSLILLFILILKITPTYAYWANDVQGDSSISNATILIGEWILFPEWSPDPTEPYEVGDVVYWEGVYYVRIKQAGQSNIEPGSPAGWVFWDPTE